MSASGTWVVPGPFGETNAVDGVDLSVEPGEIYGFLGPNDAGKSTVTRVLCTLISPSGGHSCVAGFDVENEPGQVRLRIGVALPRAVKPPRALAARDCHEQLIATPRRCTSPWRPLARLNSPSVTEAGLAHARGWIDRQCVGLGCGLRAVTQGGLRPP